MTTKVELPLISIITSVYNGGKTLEKTIQSILNQTYSKIEYIVIDGSSSDTSLEIIDRYKSEIKYWISEPDYGVYDAWNKGLKASNGEWICFVGSDDVLLPDAIANYVKLINASQVEDVHYVSSKLRYISQNNIEKAILGKPWNWQEFKRENICAHVGSLHNRRLYKEYGNYNINYKIVADYELLLRPRQNLKTLYMDIITAEMKEGGISFSLKAIIEAQKVRFQVNEYPIIFAIFDTFFKYLKFLNFKYFK